MAGLQFNRLPAQGPMAVEAQREYKKTREAAGQEYEIELKALKNQFLTDEQYHNKATILHGKHSLKALQMERGWNQRMTMIRQYEKLGASGTITPERARQEQFALSGYDVPQRKRPDYWAEHRNLIQERERLMQMNDQWDFRKGTWRQVTAIHKKGKKKDLPSSWGRAASAQEIAEIEAVQQAVTQLDQYEYSLLTQMNPQQRKVNQLSRAMAMGPRTQQTPGVGGKRTNIPLGKAGEKAKLAFPGGYLTPAIKAEPERLETPGYKMTQEKAVQQAATQLGSGASKERILDLAKQIYGQSQESK